MRVKNGVEPINHTADTARGGSRPKPPKAVAQRASLEAPRATPDHQKSKRRLTDNTVAFPPPADRCTLIEVLSIDRLSLGAICTKVSKMAWNRPRRLQRLKRL